MERIEHGDQPKEQTEFVPRKRKIQEKRYTNEELLAMLPRHEKVDVEYMKGAIDFIFEHMEFYQDIWGYLKKSINNTFPQPTNEQWRDRDEYSEDYYNYFHDKEGRYDAFLNAVISEFLNRKGERRTFDEACHIAADKWVEMIFGFHLQSNGDRESEASAMAMMLGTLAKDKAVKRTDADVPEKARQLFYEYYRGGSIYKGSRGHVFQCELHSDYGPNAPLYDILVKAGVNEKDANSITPWKTGVNIDYEDNSVEITGYQKCDYI